MKQDSYTTKILVLTVLAGACFVASLLTLGLVEERKGRHEEARQEVAGSWGSKQEVVGPALKIEGVLRGTDNVHDAHYVLPETMHYEATLAPDSLSRGIYTSAVYEAGLEASGSFSAASVAPVLALYSRIDRISLGVGISDTRGIEQQVALESGAQAFAFEPGSGLPLLDGSGLHALIPVASLRTDLPFAFSLSVKGSEGIAFAPVGRESTINVSSPWSSPKFSGAFLPSERSVADSGFTAQWRISSFGRSYPQSWQDGEVSAERLLASTAGVELYEATDFYTKVDRSTKYAILFIVVTFLICFLFEALAGVRIHAVQYGFIGVSLALFYLLLLSFSEQIGFLTAYVLATLMISTLIGLYARRVLAKSGRALAVFAILIALYGYLYFVLLLEDYALLFGSLLVFALLSVTMYLTRTVDWFGLPGARGK